MNPRGFPFPIKGRLRVDPGERHEPRVAISSSAENQHSHFVVYQSDTTGALAAAENDLRLLTSAAIEKLLFKRRSGRNAIVPNQRQRLRIKRRSPLHTAALGIAAQFGRIAARSQVDDVAACKMDAQPIGPVDAIRFARQRP